jgi:predicted Zn-ribbon and HTH transcriptional regulator
MPTFTFQTDIHNLETAADLHARLKELFAVKDALDKEIESLIGRRTEERKPYHCVRCDHKWYSRLLHRPQQCPVCRTKKFDVKPAFTYEEKLARKKERMAKQNQVFNDTVQHGGERAGEIASIRKNSGHGLQPEDRRGFDSPTVSTPFPHSVLTRSIPEEPITLTPPPAAPMSLRERLALMASQPKPEPTSAPEPVIVEQSDDELVEAINNGTTPDE